MSRRVLLPLAITLLTVTPLLAAEPDEDPAITEANKEKARAEAQKAKYEAQKAAADARFAPLSQFAGSGENKIEGSGGAMEAAYLAAVSIRDAADAINRNLFEFLGSQGDDRGSVVLDESRPDWLKRRDGREAADLEAAADVTTDGFEADESGADKIVLLAGATDTLSFDAVAAFHTEAKGLVRAAVRALRAPGPLCPASTPIKIDKGGPKNYFDAVSTIGAVVGLLQSDTTVYDMGTLGDDGMLATALMAGKPGAYIRQEALLASQPDSSDPVFKRLEEVADCEVALHSEIKRLTPKKANAGQVAEMDRAVKRIEAFNGRITTAGTDGKVPLAIVLRQSTLQNSSSRYVLRTRVNKAGGTMLKRKNLLTAIGAPPFTLSGGIIAEYTLSDRTSGVVVKAGSVVCRTRLTGLQAAMRLRERDIVCAENPPRRTNSNSPYSGRSRRAGGGLDEPVFRLPDPVPMPLD